MFRYRRPVRFADIDAARIVFFARYLEYCHDALEALFADLEGGYVRLIMERGIGIPTVNAAITYKAPLHYGDIAVFDVEVLKLGRSSITVRHTIRRERDDLVAAVVEHVVVTARIDADVPVTIPIPDDMRALLEPHMAA